MLLIVLLSVSAVHAGQIVITTSDYETGNTAVYDTVSGTFLPNAMGQADQDVVVVSDGTHAYFIERSYGSLAKYEPTALNTSSLIYHYSVGANSNPYDAVFLDEKAYVIRYMSDTILIIDPDTGDPGSFERGTIDISAFDDYGTPEAARGFYSNGMVYVVLQRLNNWKAEIPGLLLKIDPETDSVVDINPDMDGVQGCELLVKNAQYFSLVDDRLYICGHVWGEQTQGIQTVDLSDPALPQAMVVSESDIGIDITRMEVFDNAYAILHSAAWKQDEGGSWFQVGAAFWFDPITGEIGDILPVPTPEGGAVMVDAIVYVASRDDSAPGIYMVNPADNTLTGDVLRTTLPPSSMVYIGEEAQTFVAETYDFPVSFSVQAPYPNPFNPITTVSFNIAVGGNVRIDVFNSAGQMVDTLLNARVSAGMHSVVWNASACSSGVYHIRTADSVTAHTVKVTLIR